MRGIHAPAELGREYYLSSSLSMPVNITFNKPALLRFTPLPIPAYPTTTTGGRLQLSGIHQGIFTALVVAESAGPEHRRQFPRRCATLCGSCCVHCCSRPNGITTVSSRYFFRVWLEARNWSDEATMQSTPLRNLSCSGWCNFINRFCFTLSE